MISYLPASRPELGFALPQVFLDGPPDLGLVRDVAQRNGELGYRSLWTQEQLVGGASVLEPVSLLSHVASLAAGQTLGVSVLPLPQRSPIELAKQLATLDHLSDGRTIVGLGLGSPSLAPAITGMPIDRPVRRLVEGLAVMESLWSDGSAHVRGSLWTLDGVEMEPKPLQRPRPVLWLGGRQPDALDRAARLGDGWMGAGASTTTQFAEQVERLTDSLRAAGRERSGYSIAKRVYVCLDHDRRRAEQLVQRWIMAYYGRDDGRSQAAVYGNRDDVAEGLAAVAAAGADVIVVSPVTEPVQHQEVIAELSGLVGS